MQTKQVIENICYIDTINKLDNLINELLYSQDEGYINMTSSNAVKNAQNTINKFNYESDKIIKESNITISSDLIKIKKNELTEAVKKHCSKEVITWAQEVFEESCENLLLKLSINRDDIENSQKIYCDMHNLINWISEVENYSEEEKSAILKEIDLKIQKILNSKDEDYTPKASPEDSDENIFMELFDSIISGKFEDIDLNNYKLKLSKNDTAYFQNLQNRLKINKTSVMDEIYLVNYALESANIKNNSDKCKFIKEVADDFSQIKNNSTDDKTKTIKRRIELFKNKEGYFKKLLG